jgi:hypothetical protein
MIRFSILCPTDGAVEVTIDDLNAVVFDGQEDVQLVFACPLCGEEIRIGVHIPNLHLAAAGIAELFDEVSGMDPADERFHRRSMSRSDVEPATQEPVVRPEAPHIEDYCEYFRRQLAQVEDVEAVLAEFDTD